MSIAENAIIFIKHAEHAGDYSLRFTFDNGVVRTIDFGPFLRKSRNPLIQAYLDPAAFAAFMIKDGDLIWGDYDLCFPIADLYEGRI